MEWVALLVVIVILGALAGGNSLGETIRSGIGCLGSGIGCLVLIFLALLVLVIFVGGGQ